MAWLIAGLTLYILSVIAERAVVAVTPHEIAQLRAEGTPSARRALWVLEYHTRPSIAALSLLRSLLVIALVLHAFARFPAPSANNWFIHTIVRWTHLAPDTVRWIIGSVLLLAFTALLWTVNRVDLRRRKQPIAAFILKRLSWLPRISWWLLRPFVPRPAQPIAPIIERNEEKHDIELLKSISRFNEVTVRQVMQPAPRMVALDQNEPFHEVLRVIQSSGFSRLPVYNDDLDHIIGVLYVKDLVSYLDISDFDWRQMVRTPALAVPETKPVNEVLREFKEQKKHLAIVVDEYGGTAGLVTLEDILEEITGEIRDEFDDESETPPYYQSGLNRYHFSGVTTINDVCRITGIDPSSFDEIRGEADTIAGLALELFGDIPTTGQSVQWGQYELFVEQADIRRIQRIRFDIIPAAE